MNKSMLVTVVALLMAGTSTAKLPPPSEEAKAKAAEVAAKAAHNGKVDGFKLCKNMDQVAATYFDRAKAAGKTVAAAAPLAACADPGAFVSAPAGAAAAPTAAPTAPAAAAPAPTPASAKPQAAAAAVKK